MPAWIRGHLLEKKIDNKSTKKSLTCQELSFLLDWCSILDTIPDFVSIHDLEFKIIFANKALKEFLQKDPRGKRCFKTFHATALPPHYCPLKKTFDTGRTHRRIFFEKAVKRQFMVTTSPIYDQEGNLIAAIHIARDVTDLRVMEDQMERQRLVSEFILEKSPLGISFIKNRKILKTNEAFEKLSGYTREEMLGKSTAMFYESEEAFRELGEKIYGQLKTHEIVTMEGRMKRKDQTLIPVRVSVKRLSDLDDEDGESYIWTVEDLSREKEMEKARKEMNERLQRAQRLEALGVLASGIAHDFNNILTPIMGYTELAQCFASDERLKQYLKTISMATSQAKELIDNLLKFSRGQAGEPSRVELSRLIKEHVKLIQGVVPSSVVIKTEINEICRPILCDPAQLNEILMNLCTNAIHAMNEQGELTLGCTETVLEKPIHSRWLDAAPGRYAKFWVSDTGCGMDQDTLERIFDPYFTTKGPEKGTGLGLAMVFNAVKANQGFIEVESAPGTGTTFTVYFPLSDEEASRCDTARNVCENIESLSDLTILLVDDEESVLMLATEFLELAGARVIAKRSPSQALEYIERADTEDKPDILVTDLTMPKMTGDQLAAQARKRIPGLPVVIITGFGMKKPEIENRFPIVKKPFKMAELIRVIRQTLRDS
jgi:PAS domain S-box-containing protein